MYSFKKVYVGGIIMKVEEIMESFKKQIETHVNQLLDQGVRPQNIEIELLHFAKKVIYAERH